MKLSLSLCLLLFGVHISSCSKAVEENNAAPANLDTVPAAENRSARTVSNQSAETVENKSSSNPKDVVLFDGKNYIKKSGWKVPSYDDTYVNDSYQLHGKPVENMTENGKKVKTYAKLFGYKTRPRYSEEFNFEGNALDYMKGTLERHGFFEVKANGKVFMYTVFFIRKVLPSSLSNSDHEHSNQYQIQDKDGDGIFETLLGSYDELIVPNWVLK